MSCSACYELDGSAPWASVPHSPDCTRKAWYEGLQNKKVGYSEKTKEIAMNKPSPNVLRGLRWIVDHAGSDLEAASGDKAGAFVGTNEREVEVALEWLEAVIGPQVRTGTRKRTPAR